MTVIGDTLHLYDQYTNRETEKWRSMPVTKITTQSFICGTGYGEIKVRKSDMTYSTGNYRCKAFTDEGKADYLWVSANQRRILEMVRTADARTLRAIEAMLTKGAT
jgi:hypothetical protein